MVSFIPPLYLTIPFGILLLMIATGPIFYPHFWHKYYPLAAIGLGSIVALYYIIYIGDYITPIEALIEYIQFISLIGALYIISSSIMIHIEGGSPTPISLAILWCGACISNLIGTTGASMLLIRPYIRINKKRIAPYHIIFFIFIVSNVGGALTPIGDPPLFLGFLKGVPFFWTLQHNIILWVLVLSLLSLSFLFFEYYLHPAQSQATKPFQIQIKGARNLLWLPIVIGLVFVDPNLFTWVPALHFHGRHSFLREALLIAITYVAYQSTPSSLLKANRFSLEPLREVGFLFIGIFTSMAPAIKWVSHAASTTYRESITPSSLYWGTGTLSAFLDNAPTYLNFLSASMGAKGMDLDKIINVSKFVTVHTIELQAISIAAVCFGAMTYIGNGPNFMVKAIAEEEGVKMPSFGGYIIRYSIPILLPILTINYFALFYI